MRLMESVVSQDELHSLVFFLQHFQIYPTTVLPHQLPISPPLPISNRQLNPTSASSLTLPLWPRPTSPRISHESDHGTYPTSPPHVSATSLIMGHLPPPLHVSATSLIMGYLPPPLYISATSLTMGHIPLPLHISTTSIFTGYLPTYLPIYQPRV